MRREGTRARSHIGRADPRVQSCGHRSGVGLGPICAAPGAQVCPAESGAQFLPSSMPAVLSPCPRARIHTTYTHITTCTHTGIHTHNRPAHTHINTGAQAYTHMRTPTHVHTYVHKHIHSLPHSYSALTSSDRLSLSQSGPRSQGAAAVTRHAQAECGCFLSSCLLCRAVLFTHRPPRSSPRAQCLACSLLHKSMLVEEWVCGFLNVSFVVLKYGPAFIPCIPRIDEPVSFLKICRVREVFYILIAEMVTWLFIYQNSWNSTLQRGVSFSVYKLYLNKPDFKT